MTARTPPLSIAVALGLLMASTGVSAQTDALERQYDAARARIVAEPQRVLQDSESLERTAAVRDGAGSPLVAASIWLQAEAYARLGDVANARREIAAGLRIAQRLRPRLSVEGDLLRTRGDLASDDGNVGAALADYQAAYRVYQVTNDQRGQALALLSIGALYRQGSDFESALRYYGQAIDAYAADPPLLVSLLNNRGNVLTEMGQYRRALVDFRRALALVPTIDNPAFEARIFGNIARAYSSAGERDAAWKSIVQGMAIARKTDAGVGLGQLQVLAGRIAMDRGDIALAVKLVDTAFEGVDLKTTPLTARDNHRNAYAVYAAAGETTKALAHLEALYRLNEQATQLTTSTKTALMSARFDFQNQELRIARLKQDELQRNIAFERASARYQRTLFAIVGAAVALLVALLVFGVVTLRRSRNAVRRANVDLAATNVALEKALTAKGNFLATTSHEIRTPLNGILGMTQVMLRDDRLSPEMRDRLDIVQDAGVTMRALVDDILDVAKMEAGNLSVERIPTDLAGTLTDLARLWRRQAEDRGLTFALETEGVPRWIMGDPVRLRQILFNLLSNALKFTVSGGIVLRAEGRGERLRIGVSDTGIGIASHRLNEVFESFQQADNSTTRRFGGTGLGLTICRNLARAMGGEITVGSAPGAGSTFTVDLPLVVAMPPAAEVCADPDGCALVILERNPIARGMMRTLFAERAATCRFVEDVASVADGMAAGGRMAVLIDMASLRASTTDPGQALDGLLPILQRHGAPMVVMLPAEDNDPIPSGSGITLLRKPVSAKQLIDALFVARDDRAGALRPLVSDAA